MWTRVRVCHCVEPKSFTKNYYIFSELQLQTRCSVGSHVSRRHINYSTFGLWQNGTNGKNLLNYACGMHNAGA